jgi:hypothetical protein
MVDLGDFHSKRNVKRQRQIKHLVAAGERPVMEALIAVEAGDDIDTVLAAFARIPIHIYRALGADELPIDRRLN